MNIGQPRYEQSSVLILAVTKPLAAFGVHNRETGRVLVKNAGNGLPCALPALFFLALVIIKAFQLKNHKISDPDPVSPFPEGDEPG